MVHGGANSESPIHVHVAKDTPVHVHVNKKKRKPKGTSAQTLQHQKKSSSSSLPLKHKKPAPHSQSYPKPLSWEGPNHRLAILAPKDLKTNQSKSLQVSELAPSEDESDSSGNYKSKIDNLLEEVGSLHHKVTAAHVGKEQRKKEELKASTMLLKRQDAELKEYKSELNETIQENELLRSSFVDLKDSVEASRSEVKQLSTERSALLRQLMTVETDGRAAAEEVLKLRDAVKRLNKDKHLTTGDAAALAKQRDALLDRLDDFERTNRTLRKFLKESHRQEVRNSSAATEKLEILDRLQSAEAEIKRQAMELDARDKQVEALSDQVEADKNQVKSFDEFQRTLEATRAHLQNQLKIKEGDNNRLAIRLKNLEHDLDRQHIELEHTQGLLEATREKATQEKEALKKATKLQKDKAKKVTVNAESLSQQMAEKDEELESMKKDFIPLKEKADRLSKEKTAMSSELSSTTRRLKELTRALRIIDSEDKEGGNLEERLNKKLQELDNLQNENETLKVGMTNLETKYSASQLNLASKNSQIELEVNQLKNSVSQYESIMADYKSRAEQYARECEELRQRLRHQEKDHKNQLSEQRKNVEKKCQTDKTRLSELERFPDLLKSAEARSHDLQEQLNVTLQQHLNESRLLSDMTQKLDMQTSQLETMRNSLSQKQHEITNWQSKADALERKCSELEVHNRELVNVNSKREDAIHNLQDRLDDQRQEVLRLSHQLETTLTDAKRQVELQKEQNLSKERASMARISDLEAQITRSAATAQQMKRAKEDAERRFQSKLKDLKDRLEQANTTTRGMQNYVSFLKSTYANVFSDTIGMPNI